MAFSSGDGTEEREDARPERHYLIYYPARGTE